MFDVSKLSKTQKIIRYVIYLIIFVLLICAFIYLGKKDYSNRQVVFTDQEQFHKEYPTEPVNNKVDYLNISDTLSLLKKGTGILYIGFYTNDWSRYYINYLYDVIDKSNVKKLYYYDPIKDRTKESKSYFELISLLDDYLYKNDQNKYTLNTPIFLVIKDGKIIHFDDETSIVRDGITPNEYWTIDKINAFQSRIRDYIGGMNYA